MMKRITAGFLLVLTLLTLLLPAAVWAGAADPDDDDYEGELDIETNKPIASGPSVDDRDRVFVATGVIYDRNQRMYCYELGTAEVGMSHPDGVITTQKVTISAPDGMPVHVWRDGEEQTAPTEKGYTKPGAYKVEFGTNTAESLSLTFTIVSELTGAVTEYRLPSGFELTSLTVNAQALDTRTNVVDMTDEGKYEIEYRCVRTGVSYSLNCEVDHTPPKLKLSEVTKGHANGPVDISDLEKGTAITVRLNGEQIDYAPTLTRSGSYEIILQDKAGNRTVYSFVIRVYFNVNAWMFFVILAGLVVAVAVYILYTRKNLRVR